MKWTAAEIKQKAERLAWYYHGSIEEEIFDNTFRSYDEYFEAQEHDREIFVKGFLAAMEEYKTQSPAQDKTIPCEDGTITDQELQRIIRRFFLDHPNAGSSFSFARGFRIGQSYPAPAQEGEEAKNK